MGNSGIAFKNFRDGTRIVESNRYGIWLQNVAELQPQDVTATIDFGITSLPGRRGTKFRVRLSSK